MKKVFWEKLLLVNFLFLHSMIALGVDSQHSTALGQFKTVQWYQYTHQDAPHFIMDYPYHWEHVDVGAQPFEVLSVGDIEYYTPIMKVLVMEERWYLPLFYSVEAFFSVFKEKVENAEIEKIESITLQDGTKAYLGTIHWTFPAYHGIDVTSKVLSTYHNGHWVLVNLIEGRGKAFPQDLLESVKSLRFK